MISTDGSRSRDASKSEGSNRQSFSTQRSHSCNRDLIDNRLVSNPTENPVSLNDDVIPDELLFALTQMSAPYDEAEPTTDKGESLKEVLKRGPPASVWNHKSRRNNFRHLTQHPRSHGTGAVGTRDVSFIYDLKALPEPRPPKARAGDKSASRLKSTKQLNALRLPESVIPEEYHIVKSKAVLGLEYIDKANTTNLVDAEKTLRTFPSLNPTKRHEVIQLVKTFDYMLEKSGVLEGGWDLKGPTQVHNLLELVKKEQTIYDLAFSEVIRQVSVSCLERGQLLSKLRMRYADLLSRIPRQVKSLHAEVLAQRALDRRLTEELTRFKSSITVLTNELKEVKEHDEQVVIDAAIAEKELVQALEESQANANLVEEYHSLYELQRSRLQVNIQDVNKQKDMWCNSAYNLSKKIMSANQLKTSKKLNVAEKSWAKLARHYCVFLDGHDSDELNNVAESVNNWRELMFEFNTMLEREDRQSEDVLTEIEADVERWKKHIDNTYVSGSANNKEFIKPPAEVMEKLYASLRTWNEKLLENLKRFASENLINNKDSMELMKNELTAIKNSALRVYRRHKTKGGDLHEYGSTMNDLIQQIKELEKQLQCRYNGENGLLNSMRLLQGNLSPWDIKLRNLLTDDNAQLSDVDFAQFYGQLDDFKVLSERARACVGTQQNELDKKSGIAFTKLEVKETMDNVADWLRQTKFGIEAVNGKMISQGADIHNRLTEWMIQSLLHLAPDFDMTQIGDQLESLQKHEEDTSRDSFSVELTVEELEKSAIDLVVDIAEYTGYLSECVSEIVEDKKLASRSLGYEDPEWMEFLQFKEEARSWVETAELILESITGQKWNLTNPAIDKQLDFQPNRKKKKENNSDNSSYADGSSCAGHSSCAESVVDPEEPSRGYVASRMHFVEERQSRMSRKSNNSRPNSRMTKADCPCVEEEEVEQPPTPPPAVETAENYTQLSGTSLQADGGSDDEKAEVISALMEETMIPLMDGSGGDAAMKPFEINKLDEVEIQTIGLDENVKKMLLSDATLKKLQPPLSDMTQSAYEAIARVDHLQYELIDAEQRAQKYESKMINMQEELVGANEKIRYLEKKLRESIAERRGNELKDNDSETSVDEKSMKSDKSSKNKTDSAKHRRKSSGVKRKKSLKK